MDQHQQNLVEKTLAASAALVPWRPVIEAVLDAGAVLRTDFRRPGGPRGHGVYHAECDNEAERRIRKMLEAHWPDFGYRGEETGFCAGHDVQNHVWIVDPNDGTYAYLKGFRGSAVSVALLRNGEPVLGVVHAHNWPDDRGELIAWAEGGPVIRNGRVIEPVALPPEEEQVVIVSQSADRNPAANLACVAPRRYLALPSIALRLALVAAGEGVAGVSLARPVAWDLAAGHALLTGAGMVLLDQYGEPVRYDPEGRMKNALGDVIIGGEPDVCRELLDRHWRAVLEEPNRNGEMPWRLSWPTPGQVHSDSGQLARAQGCLLGQLCGDALGAQVEFADSRHIADSYPGGVREMRASPVWNTLGGQPTDDSEMALALARSLLQTGEYDPQVVLDGYRAWAGSRPFDMGNTVCRGLDGEPDDESQANGALMRISPLGILGSTLDDDATLMAWARADAALTHPHPVCRDASMLFVRALAEAIRQPVTPDNLHARIAGWAEDLDVADVLKERIALSREEPPLDYDRQAGWVLTAFHNALWQLCHASDPESALVDTVRRGGDTDTNAAIAGALLGAVHGRDAIPAAWRRSVLSARPIAGFEHVRQPRPEPFWPVDALRLAEQLLLTGAAVGRKA